MLTLLASFAQEESRSASENQRWRIQKMFEEGRPNTGNMLGYHLIDGALHIVPEEAAIVKMIFADFLSGMGKNLIMKKLNRMDIPTMRGGLWRESTLMGILTNEKYTGNMLLQKTYRPDYISKKGKINRGERPMYYVEDSHEAIIDQGTFDQVQQELKRRASCYISKKQKSHTCSRALSFVICVASILGGKLPIVEPSTPSQHGCAIRLTDTERRFVLPSRSQRGFSSLRHRKC